ncbi:MAG: hypothetical protein OXI66_12735 [Boseongicola sp.]|nr:hypothetical protein [Boseongicola sp.]
MIRMPVSLFSGSCAGGETVAGCCAGAGLSRLSDTVTATVCTASAVPSLAVTATVAVPVEIGVNVNALSDMATLTTSGRSDTAEHVSSLPAGFPK